MKKEVRFLAKAEVRAKGDGSKVIAGYASIFNSPSQDLGGFVEVIRPGAFKKSLANGADIRCLFNHSEDMILGRTASGTLRVYEDEVGLRFECDLPDTSYANDLLVSIRRSDVNQCSFGFYCLRDNWVNISEAPGVMREVIEADVFDVSPVTYPAYLETSLSARSLFPDGVPASIEQRKKSAAGTAARKARLAAAITDIEAEQDQELRLRAKSLLLI
jgi:uncharacterized protein